MPPLTRKRLSARADHPQKPDPGADHIQDVQTMSPFLSLPVELRQTVLKYVRLPRCARLTRSHLTFARYLGPPT